MLLLLICWHDAIAMHALHIIPTNALTYQITCCYGPYRYGQPPHTGVGPALAAYTAAAHNLKAPLPDPPHRSYQPTHSADSADNPVDIDYWLLQLQLKIESPHEQDICSEGSFVASALQSDAITPNVLDQLLPWRLLCALQAVRALPTSSHHAPSSVRHLLFCPFCHDMQRDAVVLDPRMCRSNKSCHVHHVHESLGSAFWCSALRAPQDSLLALLNSNGS